VFWRSGDDASTHQGIRITGIGKMTKKTTNLKNNNKSQNNNLLLNKSLENIKVPY
jgi:hypothetical protein